MPASRYYMVTQIQRVRVIANSPGDAVRIAEAGFTNGQNLDYGVKDGPTGVWGNTTSKIQTTELCAREEGVPDVNN